MDGCDGMATSHQKTGQLERAALQSPCFALDGIEGSNHQRPTLDA
jgi:hypothetical protein